MRRRSVAFVCVIVCECEETDENAESHALPVRCAQDCLNTARLAEAFEEDAAEEVENDGGTAELKGKWLARRHWNGEMVEDRRRVKRAGMEMEGRYKEKRRRKNK